MPKPREAAQTRQWEKKRRERFNEEIVSLWKLLPKYDPLITINKLDILRNTASYIKSLQKKVEDLLDAKSDREPEKEEIKRLQDKVKKLINRNEQLTLFLQHAGITVPSAYGFVKKPKRSYPWPCHGPWNTKVTPEQIVKKKKEEKENENRAFKRIKLTKPAITREKKSGMCKKTVTKSNKKKRHILSKNVILIQQPVSTQPCIILTNAASISTMKNTTGSTVVTNSTLLTTPLMSTNITPIIPNKKASLDSLGPGTLIFPSGKVLSILPQIHQPLNSMSNVTVLGKTNISTPNCSLVNNLSSISETMKHSPASSIRVSPLQVQKKIPQAVESDSVNKQVLILPKRRCLTRTTQANKVPIPSLSSFNSTFKMESSKNLSQVAQKQNANDEKKEKKKPDQVSTEIKKTFEVETDKSLDKLPIKEANVHDDVRDKMEINNYQEDNLLSTDIKENDNDKTCSEINKNIVESTESGVSNNIKIISSVCLKEPATVVSKQESQDKIPEIKVTNTEQSQIKEHISETLGTESKKSTGGLSEEISLHKEVVKSSDEYYDTNNIPAKNLHEYNSTSFDKDETNETEKLNDEVSALTEEANVSFCISPQKSDILQNFSNESLNQKSHEKQKSLEDRNEMKTLELNLPHSDLSNDIFASLQVPSGCQNPESTSPTAAFLLAFPLVSSLTGVKVSEVLDEENTVSQNGTPTLLQIGTMDTTKPTQSESLTPSLLNLDNLSFFSSKDICSSLYTSFDNIGTNNNNSHVASSNKNEDTMTAQIDLSKESEIRSIKKVDVADQSIKESLPNRENNIQRNTSFDSISAHNIGENRNSFSSDNNCDINKKSDQKEIFNKTATNSIDLHYDKKEIKNIHTAKEVLNKSEEIIHNNRNIESNESNLACMASTSVKSHDLRNLNHHAPNINDQQNITNNNNNINKIRQINTIPSNSNNNNKIENISNRSNGNIGNMSEHVMRNSINNNQKIETLNNIGQAIGSRRNIDFEPHANVSINFTNNSIPAVNITAPYQVPNVINYQSKQKCEEQTEKNTEHKNFANFNHRIQSTNQTNKYNNAPFNNYQNINSSKSYITCTYNYIPKNYIEPLYTNSTSYSYPSVNNDNYYKRSDSKNYYVGYDNYNDCRNNQVANNYYVNPQNTQKNKQNTNQVKQPINWMTTPDVRQNNDYLLAPFSKENDYLYSSNCFISGNQNNYFNSNAMYSTPEVMSEPKKAIDLPTVPMNSYQKIDIEENHRENQFSWSPTKLPQILEPPTSFVPASLTNLVGDLALGNTGNYNTTEQKCERYQKEVRGKDNNIRRSKISTGYENQSNFLSVSQLVDHNKPDNVPARPNSRRNSGSRLPKGTPSSKIHKRNSGSKDVKDNSSQSYSKNEQAIPKNNQYNMQGNDIFCDASSNANTVKNRSVSKNVSSSYSAEALIGHQMQSDVQNKNPDQYTTSSKSLTVPPFLTDNIMPYLPPVDLQQENSFSQSQNYQSTSFSHNFPTTFQNNNYNNNLIPSTTITSSYLQTNNFMPEIPNHDYIPDNFNLFPSKDNKNCSKSVPKPLNRTEKTIQTTCSNYKKTKRKHSNETSLPNFVDFSFLTVPGAINSPILPDDFHTHSTFLPPPPTSQIYPCKNPLYPKQGSDLASSSLLPLPPPVPVNRTSIQPEVSPSLNSGGTSLTNFNLSTIFPEINKQGPISNLYPDSRQKDLPVVKSYSSASTHAPFNSKSSFSLSYINCPQTTQYNH